MKNKLFIGCAIAALLLPLAASAENAPKKPVEAAPKPDFEKLREQLRNMSPEERQAKIREMREKGQFPGLAQGQSTKQFQNFGGNQPIPMASGPGAGIAYVARVLTPEQRESYAEANRATQNQTRELEDRIRDARKVALEASIASKFDEADLRKKLDAAAKLETDLTVLRAKTLAKMEPPLSEEQVQQIKNMPVGGSMPQFQRFQGQRPGQGPDGMQREPLPFGNQPLPPPDSPSDRPPRQAP